MNEWFKGCRCESKVKGCRCESKVKGTVVNQRFKVYPCKSKV